MASLYVSLREEGDELILVNLVVRVLGKRAKRSGWTKKVIVTLFFLSRCAHTDGMGLGLVWTAE